MKYDVGDIVKIKKFQHNDYVVFQNKIGIILEKFEYNQSVPAYRVLIAGIQGRKYFIYEDEIEEKINNEI